MNSILREIAAGHPLKIIASREGREERAAVAGSANERCRDDLGARHVAGT